ncbi:MAG: branched-chain amino acid ABC transporter permease, partial [Planctomycetota bacterium]
MTFFELICQQLINGLTLGSVIALIALGYTMVYGIIQLINFAHGDLYMLGTFFALTLVAGLPATVFNNYFFLFLILVGVLLFTSFFTATVNFSIEKLVYKPLRRAPRLTLLVSAIGVSFILQNIGLFWGGLPLDLMGNSAAAPKSFPDLIPKINLLPLLGLETMVRFSLKDLVVILVTFPLMSGLYLFVKY